LVLIDIYNFILNQNSNYVLYLFDEIDLYFFILLFFLNYLWFYYFCMIIQYLISMFYIFWYFLTLISYFFIQFLRILDVLDNDKSVLKGKFFLITNYLTVYILEVKHFNPYYTYRLLNLILKLPFQGGLKHFFIFIFNYLYYYSFSSYVFYFLKLSYFLF